MMLAGLKIPLPGGRDFLDWIRGRSRQWRAAPSRTAERSLQYFERNRRLFRVGAFAIMGAVLGVTSMGSPRSRRYEHDVHTDGEPRQRKGSAPSGIAGDEPGWPSLGLRTKRSRGKARRGYQRMGSCRRGCRQTCRPLRGSGAKQVER